MTEQLLEISLCYLTMGVEIPLRQTLWNRGVPDDFHVCLQADLLARGADLEGIFSAGEDPDMAGVIETGKSTRVQSEGDLLFFPGVQKYLGKSTQLFLRTVILPLGVAHVKLDDFSAGNLPAVAQGKAHC